MEYKYSNFTYLKTTNMEKYYDELVKAENICEYSPVITKIIVRKVIEGILKNIAEKHNVYSNVSAWELLNNIKLNTSIFLPAEINNYIEILLVNGYEHGSRNNKSQITSKQAIEVLETIHNILCWYLKKTEPQKMILIKDLSFKSPSTMEYVEKEVDRINEDIILKNNQINNLRQKIIDLSSQSKNITELNKIIIAIKEEKVHLETAQVLLTKKYKVQKEQVADTKKNYKIYMKKVNNLKDKCNENQEFIFNKESQLVKVEIQNQELNNLYEQLDEKDESIVRMEKSLEGELKTVRQTYEYLLKLTNQYQDILETIEFSYDKELQDVLELQENNIKMEISFQDRIFSENIINYTKSIPEAKRKMIIFKEILNETIKREIKYEPFYRGFLRLEGKELRIIYTMITNINTTSNLITKSKELLLQSSEDKFLECINKNLEELRNISSDEIKLILYYKLIKLSQIPFGKISNRRQFIRELDNMVDRAYEILMPQNDFKGKIIKLDAIIEYYLEKLITDLKNKNSKLQINEELSDKIYKKIVTLKQNPENIQKEKIYYDKFNLDIMSESVLRISIKSHPFIFLSIMVDLGGSASYKEISSIIYQVENFITKRTSSKVNNEDILLNNFSNEYFMILLFISSGAISLNQKQQEELLPLLIVVIMSIDLIGDNDEVDLENYNRMVVLWKKKQQKHNEISIEKKDKECVLVKLIKEKQELEINSEELIRNYEILLEKHNNYKDEFKKIVMNSEKRVLLPSFGKYYDLRSKKEVAEEHINESKNKLGTFKSILSPEVWKDQASKIINESNMLEAEKVLIEEAKLKPYFEKDYKVFEDLEAKIEETNKLISKEKENLKNKDLLIDNIKIEINELQRQLNNIKEAYLDIEDGY